jgi:hypothetical protein
MSDLILVYLGPSLELEKAKKIIPEAIFRPPARQGDIASDVINLNPNIVILIDGEFRQNLSPWHKEIVYALQHPGVKAIYGAASIGALRALELDYLGMIGIGKIYEWYRDGVTEDDAEVALSYGRRVRLKDGDPAYDQLTVPLVNIRAGVEHYRKEFLDNPSVHEAVDQFFKVMQAIHYSQRTVKLCEEMWAGALGVSFPCIPQKELDAVEALSNFWSYLPQVKVKPRPDHLSHAFQALYDRDRRIEVNGQPLAQQHIDSYVLLHNPEYERICWDSANQELALTLCNLLFVMVDLSEVEMESARFQSRCEIKSIEDFSNMLANNGWTRGEYDRLMVQNARIRKLQHSLSSSKHSRRNTCSILDYLRTHQGFDYWAIKAAQKEAQIERMGIDEWPLDIETSAWKLLDDQFEAEGLELRSSQEAYLLETGFSNKRELAVALSRLAAAKE